MALGPTPQAAAAAGGGGGGDISSGGGVAHPSAAVATLPPPRRHQQPLDRQAATWDRSSWERASWDRRLNLFGLVMHGATQMLELANWAHLPFTEKFQRVLSIIFAAMPYLTSALIPGFYLQHRKTLVMAFRLIFFSFPLLRKPRGIQRVLDAKPQLGLLGMLRDLYKVVWGSRLVAVVCSGIITPLPLLLHLVAQVYAVVMVRANGTLCLTPLLTHPITTHRIRLFHCVMQSASQPFGTGVFAQAALSVGSPDGEQHCQAFLTFLHLLVGLVLTTVLVVKTRADMSARSWQEAGSGGGWLDAATARLEQFMRVLCGSSWLAAMRHNSSGGRNGSGSGGSDHQRRASGQLAAAATAAAAGDARLLERWEQEEEAEEGRADSWGVLMKRGAAWFLLLCYMHGLAVAIS